ncbi:DUF2169 family type VI secretion system accessory protein [Polaromonas glacialis]|uniref:DUF2169 family type VI secretion system accessory protein n=1 Tax=Polaromonas glacialis TaxID=866564 RepID=UPI000497CF53|nr:DUF2169 domain-containing protein [Polaromonas glacialis]
MDLINATRMIAGYTMGLEPSGREWLVVVVKGTFCLPKTGQAVQLLDTDNQLPLITADTFTGKPGFSAPMEEVDFAPRKHRCDILLLGSAHAPAHRPATRVPVGLRIGQWQKAFTVVGKRRWEVGMTGVSSSAPESFITQPLSYDVAFGGRDDFHENPQEHAAFMLNPVGCGWHKHVKNRYIDGTPMPNTEALDQPVTVPDAHYAPMSFGPVGRGWASRLRYAGTYDQHWLDNTFPFLPADFSDAYYQAAPLDQQINYPQGGEDVVLVNLTPEGRTTFTLPSLEVPVVFFKKKTERNLTRAVLDTIVIHPEKRLLTLTWRASLPLKKNIFEVTQVLAGKMPRGWWRARETGKQWHPSLAQLVQTRWAASEEKES